MKAKEIARLIDEITPIYLCEDDGRVICKSEDASYDAPIWDCEVVNITTYNFGIELDLNI